MMKYENQISAATGLIKDNIRLYDTSELDRLVKRFPQAADRADLNPAKSPADIDPQDLAEVIMRLAQYKEELSDLMEGAEPPPEQRETPNEKNRKKGLREEYFTKHIRERCIGCRPVWRICSAGHARSCSAGGASGWALSVPTLDHVNLSR